MAGEDPGASTIAVILDAIQRAWSAITNSVKAVTNGVVDIVKTSLLFRWRKQMMQNGEGSLKHGYQSLKKLRRHEDRGAILKSVEIGNRDDASLFKKELKRSGIDFAITHDEDGNYTLHYKEINEKDVLQAQYDILEQRYGNRMPEEQQYEPISHDSSLEEPSHSEESLSRDDQDMERQTLEDSSHDENEQAYTARTEEADRTVPHTSLTPSAAEGVRAEAQHDSASLQEPYRGMRGGVPLSKDDPISNEPLSELKRQARERARAKNLARSQDKDLTQDHAQDRRKTRVRAREIESHR